MSFDDLINLTPDEEQTLLKQALKKQEYNRNYQRRLRVAAKLATLERRIDANLDHAIGYIKTKYAKEYEAWTKPVEAVERFTSAAFDDWVTLSAPSYRSIKEAFDLSGLRGTLTLDQFEELFRRHYKQQNNSGSYTKH